nr:interleukin-12 receptor subunit beta-1 isoform X2 [Cavia porcellus]
MGRLVAPLGVLLLLLPPLSWQSGACRPAECCFQDLPSPHGNSGSGLGPRDLSCYRVFGGGHYECSWRYDGPREGVSHFLRCCLRPGPCCYFWAGSATRLRFSDQDGVPVLRSVMLWVESRAANWTERSPEITLRLHEWVKYERPRSATWKYLPPGWLQMAWEVPEDSTQLQFRRRGPGRAWELGDCGLQDEPGFGGGDHGDSGRSRSCLCPLEAAEAQEFQFRWRRLHWSGAPGGPWSDWSDPECVPPESFPQPAVTLELAQLGQDGRRRLLTAPEQLPEPELPEGCRGATSGAKVAYFLRVHMRSCPCQAKATRTVRLGRRKLLLSGGAYDVAVVARTSLGWGPEQMLRVPAVPAATHTGPEALTVSVGADGTALRWEARAPGVTHCVEWQPCGQDTAPNCTLLSPQDPGSAGSGTHSWSPAPGATGQDQCFRVSIFASAHPEKPTAWSTVLSSYYFGGNASVAGTPPHVWVQNYSERSAAVAWAPSPLHGCPGVLTAYAVRCAEDGGRVAEWLVSPTETQVTVRDLRPGTRYTVQVRADTAWLQGTWSPPQYFSLAPQESQVFILSVSLGSFVTILLVGTLGCLGLSSACGQPGWTAWRRRSRPRRWWWRSARAQMRCQGQSRPGTPGWPRRTGNLRRRRMSRVPRCCWRPRGGAAGRGTRQRRRTAIAITRPVLRRLPTWTPQGVPGQAQAVHPRRGHQGAPALPPPRPSLQTRFSGFGARAVVSPRPLQFVAERGGAEARCRLAAGGAALESLSFPRGACRMRRV